MSEQPEAVYYVSSQWVMIDDQGTNWPDHFGWYVKEVGIGVHFQAIWQKDDYYLMGVFDYWKVTYPVSQDDYNMYSLCRDTITREQFEQLFKRYLFPSK
jgi:hypothetical protein